MQSGQRWEPADLMGGLYGDGVIALAGALARPWVQTMREDVEMLFAEAIARPKGALPRGPQRWYVEIHPERLRGFVELATHPWVVAVCEAVLGPEYRIVEIGFDIPFPGAADQPWHRDFPSPPATLRGRRLNSLAFNVTAVDTIPEMGPFEIALGTQWDDLSDCPDGMFPPIDLYPRYFERAVPKLPRVGDISARSALTIHRGTANRSSVSRPVLVLGADAPDGTNAAHHDLQITGAYESALPDEVRAHLTYRRVATLEPIVQHHTIAGLLEPAY